MPGPARARDLTKIAREWAADLMVSDEVDYGAVVAAETVEVPHVSEVVSAAGDLAIPELIAAPSKRSGRQRTSPPKMACSCCSGH